MLKALGHKIEPTRFPDGTTQVWKLPEEILKADRVFVDWRFEREDEFFSLMQLRALIPTKPFYLHVPYLPFARQDKDIANDKTFALHPFTDMLNWLRCDEITAVDVHNPEATKCLLNNFKNLPVDGLHASLINQIKPTTVIFPDGGAKKRYAHLIEMAPAYVVFEKQRDQATGKITGYALTEGAFGNGHECLVVDDICDGGATFLSLEQALRDGNIRNLCGLHLFVTHGLFSKGREPLAKAGFTLHTTNSLPRNPEGIPV